MKLTRTLGAAVLAAGMTVVGFAQQNPDIAGTPQGRHEQHRGAKAGKRAMFGRGFAQLNLTDAQKQTARQLFQDARTQSQQYREQLKQNRQDLEAAIKANNATAIQQLTERQASLRGQVSAIHAKAMAAFYAQLTPEQKAKADELKTQRHNRRNNG